MKGLVVGAGLGVVAGAVLLVLKWFVANQLTILLDDMAQASCKGCHFKVDNLQFSLSTLRANGTNARIELNGSPKFFFKKLSAEFSLRQYERNIALLENLTLDSGTADGIGPDSTAFKFVDFLTSPPRKDRTTATKWRLKLLSLNVLNSTIIEPLHGSSVLKGENVNVSLTRNPDDSFSLQPTASRLFITSAANTTYELGHLHGHLLINAGTISLQPITLSPKSSELKLLGKIFTTDHTRIDATLSGNLNMSDIPVAGLLAGDAALSGKLSGLLARPTLDFNFTPTTTSPIYPVLLPGLPKLTNGTGNASVKFFPQTTLTINNAALASQDSSLTLQRPFYVDSNTLSGSVKYYAANASLHGSSVKDISLSAEISGTPTGPTVKFDCRPNEWTVGPVVLRPQSVIGSYQEDSLNLLITENQSKHHLKVDLSLSKLSSKLPFLNSATVSLSNWPINPTKNTTIQIPQKFADLKLTASGPFAVASLNGELMVTLRSEEQLSAPLFNTTLKLENGILSGNLANASNSISGALRLNSITPSDSSINLSLTDFSPASYDPELRCISISLNANYQAGSALNNGNGAINLDKVSFGCSPYTTALQKPATIPIKAGTLTIPQLIWQGLSSSLSTSGLISIANGYNVDLIGTIHGDSLLALVPRFDDLHGQLEAKAKVLGPILSPEFSGTVKVNEVGFSIESAQIMGSDISGQLEISGDQILLKDIKGAVNGGDLKLSGVVLPLEISRSNFKLQASDIQLSPIQGASVIVDTDLKLSPRPGDVPLLTGNVNLVSGELQRSLDLKAIVSALTRYILSNKESKATLSELPELELDIKVSAARGMFVDATIFSTELAANLDIRGRLNNPAISGTVDTLSGWIVIKDARFDVTNGQITFIADRESPEIKILAETNFRTREGENVTTFLEVTGDLFDPKVRLSSDQGYTEAQLLALLTAGSAFGRRTLLNAPGFDSASGRIAEDLERGLSLSSLLRRLTDIDVLTIEPQLNSRTGEIEPALFARKNINSNMSLIAQSSLGQSFGEARAGLTYDLSSAVNVTALADSTSNSNNPAVGIDVIATLLARQRDFLRVKVRGASQVKKRKLLQAVRLGASSRLSSSELPQIERALTQFLIGQGLLNSSVSASCLEQVGVCRELTLDINEGPIASITQVSVEGVPSSLVSTVNARLPKVGTPATEETRFNTTRFIVQLLRNEGYIAAVARTRYLQADDQKSYKLDIHVIPGSPVSFIFKGNTRFSPRQFLETINLFTRSQPFGSNTINILVANVERLYREAGFLLVTIAVDTTVDEGGRKIYTMNINEDTKVPVKRISFKGFVSISESDFKTRASSLSGDRYQSIFSPSFALAEALDENTQVIQSILVEEGFPRALVNYEISPISDDYTNGVEVVYTIEEGQAFKASSFITEGLPDNLDLSSRELPPYSVPKINRMVSELLELLKNSGYFEASVAAEVNADLLTLRVDSGVPALVGKILVEGNSKVKSEAVRDALTFKSGDRLRMADLDRSRSNLLQQGLFARVAISRVEGGDFVGGAQDVLVQVTERPLTTLELGTGVNSEDGIHVIAEATDRSLFADGRSLSIQADTYFSESNGMITRGGAGLRFVEPRIFGSDIRFSQDLRFQKVETITLEFDAERVTLSSLLYKLTDGRSPITFGHSLVREKITDVPSDVILSEFDEGNVQLGFLQFSATHDRRDDPLLPRDGWFAGLEGKLAHSVLGSDANFLSLVGRLTFTKRLANRLDRFSVASGLRLGVAEPFGDLDEMPISQRFYTGGRASVRGFRENSLGPRTAQGNVIGGDLLAVNNLELRYSISEDVQLHSFLDLGLLDFRDSVSTAELRESAGLGLFYLSPIGPIGFDVGFPLDRKSGEPAARLHFSIGTNF